MNAVLQSTRQPLITFDEIITGRHDSERMIELAHRRTYDELASGPNILKEHEQDHKGNGAVKMVEFKDTLKTELLFNAFMEHLFRECCAECLLAIVEFTQFKQKIVEENKEFEFENNVLELYGSLIKSSIVYSNVELNDTINYTLIATALYNKYIRVGSECEINIDYESRIRYRDLFANDTLPDNVQELYTLFDPCINKMVALIISPFTRFKKGKKYQMIQRK